MGRIAAACQFNCNACRGDSTMIRSGGLLRFCSEVDTALLHFAGTLRGSRDTLRHSIKGIQP
jgi:hypothetical protein